MSGKIIFTKQPQSIRFKIILGKHYPGFEIKAFISIVGSVAIVWTLSNYIPDFSILDDFFFFIFLPCAAFTYIVYQFHFTTPNSPPAEKYQVLEINPQTFFLEKTLYWSVFGNVKTAKKENKTSNIVGVGTISFEENPKAISTRRRQKRGIFIVTRAGKRRYTFCAKHLLQSDANWLKQEIEMFLDRYIN